MQYFSEAKIFWLGLLGNQAFIWGCGGKGPDRVSEQNLVRLGQVTTCQYEIYIENILKKNVFSSCFLILVFIKFCAKNRR
jgi:hypothetical protein